MRPMLITENDTKENKKAIESAVVVKLLASEHHMMAKVYCLIALSFIGLSLQVTKRYKIVE